MQRPLLSTNLVQTRRADTRVVLHYLTYTMYHHDMCRGIPTVTFNINSCNKNEELSCVKSLLFTSMILITYYITCRILCYVVH